jgi:hypothetical protein
MLAAMGSSMAGFTLMMMMMMIHSIHHSICTHMCTICALYIIRHPSPHHHCQMWNQNHQSTAGSSVLGPGYLAELQERLVVGPGGRNRQLDGNAS